MTYGMKVNGFLKDGRQEGLWIGWHENGLKVAVGTWKKGIEVGKWTFYNEDGTVKEVKDFSDG